MRTFYKIVEIKDDHPHTLYHGLNRSRKLPVNKWLRAEEKMVNDGGSPYLSGFHVFVTQKQATDYLKRFTAPRDLRIVECYARKIWPKPTNHNVTLAEEIKVIYEKNPSNSGAS